MQHLDRLLTTADLHKTYSRLSLTITCTNTFIKLGVPDKKRLDRLLTMDATHKTFKLLIIATCTHTKAPNIRCNIAADHGCSKNHITICMYTHTHLMQCSNSARESSFGGIGLNSRME